MKNKIMAILGAAVISASAIGITAFASGAYKNNQLVTSKIDTAEASTLVQDLVNTSVNYNKSSANNSSKNLHQDMIKIMIDNRLKEAASYIQNGNYTAMTNYMNNLSQKDYDRM
ncbi:hypothetical protein [Candidatus Clostridium stratigraminis]|uniref:Uncharacterized protein n=1 Tax=Candidatus Clostridium stratigraminis TaxID=3381661 RepID=A0ABW8T7U8_9CLOT